MLKTLSLTTALLASPAFATSQEVTLQVPGAELHATLQVPEGTVQPPVALILAGSGPTDRDGNSPAGVTAASYRKLASVLEAAGIATLRPDKRGIGASRADNPSEAALRFTDYVTDARAWLTWLSQQQSGGTRTFGPLVLIGHSEGSLIGLAALQQPPVPVAAFVSLAGPGENLATTLRRQLHSNPANPAALVQESDRILDQLLKGETVAQVSPLLAPIFRPSVQPYLISEFRADPPALIGALKLPILIAQGDHDLQVGVSDAQALARAQPTATLLLVPGMNHVLVDAPADPQGNLATYARADLPISEGLADGLTGFLKGALK
ncbi:alpha/beta hydrolase [Deinococcus sonorensis]|uniref:Alpha/beta fold hydrolase n=2 Tax=Deinococcus sonorensis TaxID=309891 RepID=A0AAU7UAV9_9DEIO